MNDIQIMEKPDWVSWDDIHEALWKAHEKNREKGIYMRYPSLSGDELRNLIGEQGKCFVAIYDGKIIGTNAYILKQNRRWYAKGQTVAHLCLASVLPEYQGSTVYFNLVRHRQKYIDGLGIKIVDMDTEDNNKMVQKLLLKQGFKYVGYMLCKTPNPHYSVIMARWLNGCPFSDRYCAFRFWVSKLKVRLKYLLGKVKRIIK